MKTRRSSFWKSSLGALAVGASTLAIALPASAQDINVFVDGSVVNFAGVPPTNQGGRLLVPLRGVFEALGAQVDYNASTRTIDALRGSTRLQLTIGSSTAYVNGAPVQLDAPAQTSVGRTLVPLRFVGEALGAQVNWDANTRSVVINSPTPTTPNPLPQPNPQPNPVPNPTPDPIPNPPVEQPNTNETISGTLINVDDARNGRITIRDRNIESTYTLTRNAVIERKPLINRSTIDNPIFGTTTRITTSDLHVGVPVELTLERRNRVSHVVAMPSVSVARVWSAQGNRIVLDDGRQTPFVIGANLRYIDSQGREMTSADLRRDDEVVVFIDPDTRRAYQISSYRGDVNAAYGRDVEDDYLPPVSNNPNDNQNNADRPTINLVTFTTNNQNATVAKAGDVITIDVRGTAGLRATFDLGGRAINLPLRERPQRPGNYSASYTVRAGDDVTNGRIRVTLTGNNGDEITQQSLDALTIDTKPPVVTDTRPLAGTTIDNSRPNIIIYADELGSGLAPSTISITNRGETFDIPTTAAQVNSVSAIPQRDLSGRVDVTAEIRDEAGNTTTKKFFFTVRNRNSNPGTNDTTGNGAITSIYHNARRVLLPGERLIVDMIADTNGRASFDLVDANDRVVARDIPMTEIQRERGHYRGEYTIQAGRDTGQLRIIGRFRDADNRISTSEATTNVDIAGGDATLNAPTITAPTEGDIVGNQITVRGRGVAGSLIKVSIHAQGVRYFVLPYDDEVTAPTVRVRNNGVWETAPITLPAPRNVSNLRFIISATQTDGADRTSEATSVTVKPQ
jgi:hypothetical protein